MEVPVALNVTPLNAPHRDLDYLLLVDKDFQIKDLVFIDSPLRIFCRCRDNYFNGLDMIGLWESNIPRYLFPSIHIFHEIICFFHENYDPNQRAVLSPNQDVLFPITAQYINEMLNFQPDQTLTPLSMGDLLEKSTKLSQEELSHICQTFMFPYHQLKGPPPYGYVFFTEEGRLILEMISSIMGFNSSEYVDHLTLVLLSIFTPGQPPAVRYDFASLIAHKIHDQFMRL